MKKLFTLSAAIVFSLSVFSQAPAILWQKSYGGSDLDVARSICRTMDGCYVVTGTTSSNDGDVTGPHGYNDIWVIKIDSLGNLIWQRTFGGSGGDNAYEVQPTSDGGYIIAGYTTSFDGNVTAQHGNGDYWILKLNSLGNLQWQESLGGSEYDVATSAKQTTDGGYIIAGYSSSNDGDVTGHHGLTGNPNHDYWIVKLNSSGSIQWQKSLGGSATDEAFSIEQTYDDGFIAAGYSYSNDGDVSGSHGGTDYWIVKLTSSGNIQWQKSLGGSWGEVAFSIKLTSDNGYIASGQSSSNDGDVTGNHLTTSGNPSDDYWIVKLDSLGNIQWQKSIGGSDLDFGASSEGTTDGGHIAAGWSWSNDGDISGHHGDDTYPDYSLVKLNSTGNIQWQKSLGGTSEERAYSTLQTADGGFIIAGTSASNDGDVTGNHVDTIFGNPSNDFWIVKLTPDVGIAENNPTSTTTLSPNPTSSELLLTITNNLKPNTTLSIYNFLGAVVLTVPVTNSQTNINIRTLPAGVYFINVKEGEKSLAVKKFVKI